MIAIRHLCLIFGDQLNEDSILFDGFDPQQDLLWMAETLGENTHVPSGKQRSVMFIAAMRHFAHRLRQHNFPLVYRSLDDTEDTDFAMGLSDLLQRYCVSRVRVVLPGDYRVLHAIREFFLARNIPVDVLADNHFIALPGEFTAWCNGKNNCVWNIGIASCANALVY